MRKETAAGIVIIAALAVLGIAFLYGSLPSTGNTPLSGAGTPETSIEFPPETISNPEISAPSQPGETGTVQGPAEIQGDCGTKTVLAQKEPWNYYNSFGKDKPSAVIESQEVQISAC